MNIPILDILVTNISDKRYSQRGKTRLEILTSSQRKTADFNLKVPDTRFTQNKPWKTKELGSPQIKFVFTFDNIEEINDCPFVCKISDNMKEGKPYFGVIYGLKEGIPLIQDWLLSRDVDELKLFTYEGKFIERLRP